MNGEAKSVSLEMVDVLVDAMDMPEAWRFELEDA